MNFDHLHPVSWYPGHMLKAQREISKHLKLVDAAVLVLDARAPLASWHIDMADTLKNKARLLILNKSDLADPKTTNAWLRYWRNQGYAALSLNARKPNLQKRLLPRLIQAAQTGQNKRRTHTTRILVVGLPNLGKSSLINGLRGRPANQTGPRPGVTRHQQWTKISNECELLDTPGVMMPRVDDVETGLRLGLIAAVKETIIGVETLAAYCLHVLESQNRLDTLERVCGITAVGPASLCLQQLAKRWGLLLPGGDPNTERAAIRLLQEFREGRLGKISLEQCPQSESAQKGQAEQQA